MKTLHFDCFAGISGDMTLGALVDLGADPALLLTELEKLNLSGWKLEFVSDERSGITGTRALVEIEGCDEDHGHHHEDRYEHHHGYQDDYHDDHCEHHEHHHENQHEHHHDDSCDHEDRPAYHHHHRNWKDIRCIIENSSIQEGAKKRALDIFSRIAKAESGVHGVPVDEVTFHEVGALDSIIDIVGTAVCLDMLAPERITAGMVELGGGTVRCAHGELPVPAPATLILCRGMPVHTGGFNREMTTPTGAAILASQVDEFVFEASFTELKTGYGIGARKLDKPNVLRVSWREIEELHHQLDETLRQGFRGEADPAGQGMKSPEDIGKCVVLETNIDDMTGEEMGFLMECLYSEGARDVLFIPCVMKKGRPGTLVSVLCPPSKCDALRNVMFTMSKTIGLREIPARCFALKREEENLSGEYGGRKKTVYYHGEKLRDKIEFESRAELARKKGISLWEAEELLRK
ncbi:MAG: nickel pincer cofactor biosynthesis protein LarC [Treponema sp.]|nr:nickel pincer cofactor biosynthesis protein LarC [Treponema sp.]